MLCIAQVAVIALFDLPDAAVIAMMIAPIVLLMDSYVIFKRRGNGV